MRWALALLLLAGALVAPASGSAAAFPDSTFDNQCQYSYDRYWRPVPMIFGGTLTNGAGAELTSGTQLAVGDQVQLRNGTVSAILPSWITTFAYEAGMIPAGDGQLPVRAWLALEATNTAEGVRPPILLNTQAATHVVLNDRGVVDEAQSWVRVADAPVPQQTWTATGGEIQVRQALGESLPPLPVGRNGADVRVRGSLFVEATLTFPSGEIFRLYLDCLQGDQVDQGSSHTDALPGSVGVFSVPGWTGTVGGATVPGPVDADLLANQGPPRADLDQQAVLRGASLRLRLTDAQRAAWLGGAPSSVPVQGSVVLAGDRSDEGSQTLSVAGTAAVPATGPAVISLPLPDSTWTAATAEGIDIRGGRTLELRATVGGETRTLTLTRISPVDPYPFARILRAADPPTPLPPDGDGGGGSGGGGGGGAGGGGGGGTTTPAAIATPIPTPAATSPKVAIRSSALKIKSRQVTVALRCTGTTTCRGSARLRTAAKVKVGKRSRVVTLTGATKYAVPAGKTANVRLALTRDGRSLMTRYRSLRVNLEVRPAGGSAVTRKLTLKR